MSPSDRLNAAKIRGCLGDTLIGREVVVCRQTTSTNDEVWQRARNGAKEGLVVFAEQQTHGRGQRGNVWESAAYKGLWLSILLRPNTEPKEPATLARWAAGVVVTTLRNEFQIAAELRFPNDVYVDDRKLAGVLVEFRAQPGAPHIAIVGIGINVTHQSSDFPESLRGRATSLAMINRCEIDRISLAVALLRTFNRLYKTEGLSLAAAPVGLTN